MSRAGEGSVGARGGSPPAATQPAPRRSPSCTPANERGCTRSLFKPFLKRLWEKVSVDSSGKFRTPSFRGNRYYSPFICAKSGRKLYFDHRRKSHFPLVFLKFVAHVGCFPKVLVSDKAGEILSKVMKTTVTAKQVKMVTVAKDEHFTNGGPEKAIQDIDNMVKCCMADRN